MENKQMQMEQKLKKTAEAILRTITTERKSFIKTFKKFETKKNVILTNICSMN